MVDMSADAPNQLDPCSLYMPSVDLDRDKGTNGRGIRRVRRTLAVKSSAGVGGVGTDGVIGNRAPRVHRSDMSRSL